MSFLLENFGEREAAPRKKALGFDPDKRIGDASSETERGRIYDEAHGGQAAEYDPDQRVERLLDGGDVKPETIEDIRRWLPEINPHYDPYDIEYCSNCGSCALAVFKRLQGDSNATADNRTLSIPEMEAATGRRQVQMSPEEIKETLIGRGPGSCAIVGIDRESGPGHWFCAYSPDGRRVYALDGQTGEVLDWPPDYGDVRNWDMSY